MIVVLLLAAAQLPAADSLARTNISSTEIAWEPMTKYASVNLVVRGPDGTFYQGEFGEGPIRFSLTGDDGIPLPDGTYVYELTATPIISPELQGLRERMLEGSMGAYLALQQVEANGQLPRGPFKQSGYFTVSGGFAAMPDLVEDIPSGGKGLFGAAPLDQVILDDLIVDGSACIGLDCVNGESFGFDTIRIN
jgi:hypothetical protein